MGLKEDLESEVRTIFQEIWTTRNGQVVPEDDSLKLGNDAITLDATVLYADISDSTKLVDGKTSEFAAEIYKTFLLCAGKIIRNEGGTITAYDGDRIMAVYIGDSKNSSAVKTGLKIHYAAKKIIQPELKAMYTNSQYELKHVVGIDTSSLFVAKTGVRGNNDLVWVGRAANYAAKLCTSSDTYPTWITEAVYSRLSAETKYSKGVNMWEATTSGSLPGITVYRSTYWWSL